MVRDTGESCYILFFFIDGGTEYSPCLRAVVCVGCVCVRGGLGGKGSNCAPTLFLPTNDHVLGIKISI